MQDSIRAYYSDRYKALAERCDVLADDYDEEAMWDRDIPALSSAYTQLADAERNLARQFRIRSDDRAHNLPAIKQSFWVRHAVTFNRERMGFRSRYFATVFYLKRRTHEIHLLGKCWTNLPPVQNTPWPI